MKSKLFLSILGMSSAASLFAVEKPNVLIIMTDDLGIGDLSAYGAKTISTPNIDHLADMGIRFTNGHSAAATSTPSRYSLLTGEYPWRKKGTSILKGNAGIIIEDDKYSMADMFKENGYSTGVIGKWHLGIGVTGKQDWNGTVTPGPESIGFDYSFLIPATGDRTPCVFLENGKVVNLDPNDPITVSYGKKIPGVPTGKDNPELLRVHPSHGHDQSIINGVSRIGYMKGGESALWKDEEIASTLVEKFRNFMNKKESGKPFFMYFATHDIHVPRLPHKDFLGKSGMGVRGDAILQLDWTVGEVMKILKENKCLDNTIIIFSSDNGAVLDNGYKDQSVELAGEHKISGPFRGGKGSNYEGGTRIPFLVAWPEHIKPGVSDALVSQVDIFASLGSVIGDKKSQSLRDSRNQWDALSGKDKTGRDHVILLSGAKCLSVISGDYKYISPSKGPKVKKDTKIETGASEEDQLYNIKEDIFEENNLAAKYPEKVSELKSLIK